MAKKLIQLLKLDEAFKDQSGSMTFFVTMLFTTMVGIAGIAIDIARFEARRTEIQSNLDNCTLSAASLRKSISPRDVVIDCMETARMHADYTVVATNEAYTITHRKVTATGEINLDTYFMRLFGVDDLNLHVTSVAEERIPYVEVSLALDVSGSMEGSRLDELIPAAKGFVNKLLSANDDVDQNRISISLIPYNMQVNAGEELFTEIYGPADHDYSYCLEWDAQTSASYVDGEEVIIGLTNDPFSELELFDPTNTYTNQSVHFGYKNSANNYSYGYLDESYCREEVGGQILPFSRDADALNDQIDSLYALGGTSIDIAVKWGVALLDPSSRPAITALTTLWQTDASTGDLFVDEDGEYVAENRQAVDPGFAGRPVDFTNDVTLKVLVVMTDGENDKEYRIYDSYRGTGNSGVYYKASTDEYTFSNPGYYSSGWVQLGWTNMWGRTPVKTYLKKKGERRWSKYMDSSVTNLVKNANLSRICGTARDAGIVIFSIAYDATDDGKDALRDCAGSSAFYKEASELSIEDVFAEVGGVIEKLKLVQ
jgi:hypothetical protein